MRNFWQELDKHFLVMAPMAGYTDQPFRLMCKRYGADVLVSEMVSSEAIWHNRLNPKSKILNTKQIQNTKCQSHKQLLKTLELIRFSKIERPYVVQIFGSDSEKMAYTAEYIASGRWYKDYQEIINAKTQILNKSKNLDSNVKSNIPDGIDINMGCPAKDVVKSGSGVALMIESEKASEIVKAVRKKVKNIPISVKTRLGWDKSDEIVDFAKRIEKAGAQALAIHGRTYKQGFQGKVDWKMISKVKSQLSIPVIGNGGIDENFRYKELNLEHELDGYMVGRGALGKPWIFKRLIANSKQQGVDLNYQKNKNQNIGNCGLKTDISFIKKNILEHAKMVDKYKGEWGIREFRKHFAWYLKGLQGVSKIRQEAVRVNNLQEVNEILTQLK